MTSVFIVVFAILVGPGAMAFGLWRFYKEVQPRTWVKVAGVITQSTVERQATGKRSYQYIPIIEFEFVFEGFLVRAIEQERFTLGTSVAAASTVAKYPHGTTVIIRVNPKNPSQACLDPQITPVSWLIILVGASISAMEVMAVL